MFQQIYLSDYFQAPIYSFIHIHFIFHFSCFLLGDWNLSNLASKANTLVHSYFQFVDKLSDNRESLSVDLEINLGIWYIFSNHISLLL